MSPTFYEVLLEQGQTRSLLPKIADIIMDVDKCCRYPFELSYFNFLCRF